jgi:putative peptidoglycan lipid II flippase
MTIATAVDDSRRGRRNGRILRAASWITAATVLVKVVATGKELLVAAVYGRGALIDAFMLAVLIPGLLVNLFAESMNQALVPAFIHLRAARGEGPAARLLTSALSLSFLFLLALAALLAIAAPLFFRILFPLPSATLALAIRLFRALLPFALFCSLASNGAAVLNASECFAAPALAPILTPLAIVLTLLAAPRSWGIWSLVAGNLFGALLWSLVIFLLVVRSGQRFAPVSFRIYPELRQLIAQYVTILLSGLVACGGLITDQVMASRLAVGSVSALTWASRFSAVLMTILGGAIGTAITPYLAQSVAAHDWSSCRSILRRYVALSALVTLPLAALLIFASRPIIAIAFQHGAFHAQDTKLVASVQSMFALQIPFFVVSRVFYRFLLVLRRSSLVLLCGAINLVLDIVLNLILMRVMGVAGIALATSLWTVSTFIFLAYWSRRLLRQSISAEASA